MQKTMKGRVMVMERKRRGNSGFYITLCCCAVIIAAVGYAGRISMVEEEEPEITRVAESAEVPEATPKPEAAPVPEKKAEEVNNNVVVEEPLHFEFPVEGKIIAEFSGDDLVYNEALKDWRAHSGVDFEAKQGSDVLASAAGTVEEVFDSEMGRCVIIDHRDGFKTMYANLGEDTTLKKGDKVSKGDKVGTTGNTALGDISEGGHLHFEMIKNGENVNPVDYLD